MIIAREGGFGLGCMCPLFIMCLFAAIGYSLGKRKTIGPTGGMALCFFTGFLGVFILMLLQDKRPEKRRRDRRPIRPRRQHDEPGRPKRHYDEPDETVDGFKPALPVQEIRTACPNCSKKYIIKDLSRAGKKARCSKCKIPFIIPE